MNTTIVGSSSDAVMAPMSAIFGPWIDRLDAIDEVSLFALYDLRTKIAAQTFDLVVAGEFKRGKSSVINALVGAPLLPVAVVPLTSVVTILSYAETIGAEIVLETRQTCAIAIDDLREYVTEAGNPGNVKRIAEVHVTCPVEFLRSGVRLVDTPGVGSIYAHNTDTTYGFLPRADAVLFVLSVDQPLSAGERNFLAYIGEHVGKTFFLLNKIDLLDRQELEDSLAFTRAAIGAAVKTEARLFPISSRLALPFQSMGPVSTEERSGFPALRNALAEFLRRDRGAMLERSIARQILRLASHTRLAIEIEHKALMTPLAELAGKIRRLDEKKLEILQTRDDNVLMMGKEAVRLWMSDIDRDLDAFRATLNRHLVEEMERSLAAHADLSTRQLSGLLEASISAEIRHKFDAWRSEKDKQLAHEVSDWCGRSAHHINDSVDELLRFAAELFGLGYEAIRTEVVWNIKSDFHYKFWSEPPSLAQLASALMLRLPRVLGHRMLRRHFSAFVHDNVDVQAGRTRADLLQRVETSIRDLRSALIHAVDEATAEIEVAADKAVRLRKTYEQASAQRAASLRADMSALVDLEAEILAIYSDSTSDSREGASMR